MKNKILSILLICLMAFALTGCNKDINETETSTEEDSDILTDYLNEQYDKIEVHQ